MLYCSFFFALSACQEVTGLIVTFFFSCVMTLSVRVPTESCGAPRELIIVSTEFYIRLGGIELKLIHLLNLGINKTVFTYLNQS